MGIVALMAMAYGVSQTGFIGPDDRPRSLRIRLVAFGFLGMGPVTIGVDSYGQLPTMRRVSTSCR